MVPVCKIHKYTGTTLWILRIVILVPVCYYIIVRRAEAKADGRRKPNKNARQYLDRMRKYSEQSLPQSHQEPKPTPPRQATRPERKDTMNKTELNRTAKDLLAVRYMIRELEAEAESLTDKLKAEMVDTGTETLEGDGWTATWKNVKSSRFDGKAFKAAHADLYDQYSREPPPGS